MKREILKEEVDQIINQSFWGKSGVRLTENTSNEEVPAEEQAVEGEVEQVTEETEEHTCPLCESHLDAPISDEQLTEHINLMVGIISEMSDVTDEELEGLEEAAEEVLAEEDNEDEMVEEAKKSKEGIAKNLKKHILPKS